MRETKFNWIIIFIVVINIFADSVIGIFAVETAHQKQAINLLLLLLLLSSSSSAAAAAEGSSCSNLSFFFQ
jgi:hypothetical protein